MSGIDFYKGFKRLCALIALVWVCLVFAFSWGDLWRLGDPFVFDRPRAEEVAWPPAGFVLNSEVVTPGGRATKLSIEHQGELASKFKLFSVNAGVSGTYLSVGATPADAIENAKQYKARANQAEHWQFTLMLALVPIVILFALFFGIAWVARGFRRDA